MQPEDLKITGMGHGISLVILLLALGLAGPGILQAGNIVYPRRVSTVIVMPGKTFDVWFESSGGQTVNSVELAGPYNTVATSIDIGRGDWEYDADSHNSYDTKITVTVPQGIPSDRYDLVLKTSTGDETTYGGVKVIKEYRDNYYIMHVSDAHRWHKYLGAIEGTTDVTQQSIYIAEGLSVVFDLADIIDPEIFVETGDDIYNLDRNGVGAETSAWMSTTWEHGVPKDYYKPGSPAFDTRGTASIQAACFAVAGNHDSPGTRFQGNSLERLSQYYNKWYGLQNFNFSYGDVRYMGANNGWYDFPFPPAQKDAAIDFLAEEGNGKMQVIMLHVNDAGEINPFYDALADKGATPDLVLTGHNHGIFTGNPFSLRGRSVQYNAPGLVDFDKAPFNLYRVDNTAGTFTPVGNSRAVHNGVKANFKWDELNLKLTYDSDNNGELLTNRAAIMNDFDFTLEEARIRFVMKKGYEYSVSNGEIYQAFDGDNVHIVDVRVDAPANSTISVDISSTGPAAMKGPGEVNADIGSLLLNSSIDVYDVRGNHVRRFVSSGKNSAPIMWDRKDFRGARVPGGVYLLKTRGNNLVEKVHVP